MMPVPTVKAETSHPDLVLIDFALQGGGAHGAFTWGALDRLLEEPWLQIDGISGTSAGAMNAAVLVDGHAKGGGCGAGRTRGILAQGIASGVTEPTTPRFSRRAPRSLEFGPFACLRRDGHDGAAVLTLRSEPRRVQPAAANPWGVHRLRAARAGSD